jgi:hypothetical protein
MAAAPADLNNKTVAGLLAYCEYLTAKGYASAAQVSPWRTAIIKVFETVEGEGYPALDLATIDLDDYLRRFQTLSGDQYKAESIVAYKRRVQNAIGAHDHFLSTGRPPTFRKGGGKRPKDDKAATATASTTPKAPVTTAARARAEGTTALIDYPFVLKNGQVAILRLPPRLAGDDVNRITGILRAMQDDPKEQRQIPEQTSPETAQAA